MFKSIYPAASLALMTVVFAALPLHAQTVSRTVRHADLDLTSPAGQQTLERRVNRAVGDVCGRHAGGNSMLYRQIRKCRDKAESGARAQMNVAIARAERRGQERLASIR